MTTVKRSLSLVLTSVPTKQGQKRIAASGKELEIVCKTFSIHVHVHVSGAFSQSNSKLVEQTICE